MRAPPAAIPATRAGRGWRGPRSLFRCAKSAISPRASLGGSTARGHSARSAPRWGARPCRTARRRAVFVAPSRKRPCAQRGFLPISRLPRWGRSEGSRPLRRGRGAALIGLHPLSGCPPTVSPIGCTRHTRGAGRSRPQHSTLTRQPAHAIMLPRGHVGSARNAALPMTRQKPGRPTTTGLCCIRNPTHATIAASNAPNASKPMLFCCVHRTHTNPLSPVHVNANKTAVLLRFAPGVSSRLYSKGIRHALPSSMLETS